MSNDILFIITLLSLVVLFAITACAIVAVLAIVYANRCKGCKGCKVDTEHIKAPKQKENTMPKVKVTRTDYTSKSCIGKVEVIKDDKTLYTCYSLENPVEGVEANKDLRIPAGVYKMEFQASSMSGAKENGGQLPILFNDVVPRSRLIRIHAGNAEKDTQGCILLGKSKDKDFVGSSKVALKEFLAFFDVKGSYELEIINTEAKA